MDVQKQTAGIWTAYGAHQLTVCPDLPEIERWDWGIADTGPGIESLGDVKGLRVLDLGSGLGRHAARLAALGAEVTAVDASATQHERAVTRYPSTPRLRFVCADAVAHLQDAAPYDLIYSVNCVPYLDPHRLLPALANAVRPGGRVVFSALHTNSAGAGPSTAVAPPPENFRLPGTTLDHPVHMWVPDPPAVGRPVRRARPRRGQGHGDRRPAAGQCRLLPAVRGPPSAAGAEPPAHQHTSAPARRRGGRSDHQSWSPLVRLAATERGSHRVLVRLAPGRTTPTAVRTQRAVPDGTGSDTPH